MASRPGYRAVKASDIPEADYLALEALARSLGRSLSAEIAHAIRRHVACPPSYDVPLLPPANPGDQPRVKRGRKPKNPSTNVDTLKSKIFPDFLKHFRLWSV